MKSFYFILCVKIIFLQPFKIYYKKVKKINSDAVTIKSILKQGMQPIKITRL